MKKVKITKNDIGRWVTVKWDDVGRRDSILLDVDPSYKCGCVTVFDLDGTIHNTVSYDQIIEKRGFLTAA